MADFNLSRSVIEHAGILNAELNSVEWAAPEKLAGKAYGREADVYSFGVCLWSLVTLQVRCSCTVYSLAGMDSAWCTLC